MTTVECSVSPNPPLSLSLAVSIQLEFTLALTPALSPGERENRRQSIGESCSVEMAATGSRRKSSLKSGDTSRGTKFWQSLPAPGARVQLKADRDWRG